MVSPRRLHLLGDTARVALGTELNQDIFKYLAVVEEVAKVNNVSGNAWMTGLFLAMERRRGPASFYHPFIAQLPRSYPMLPPYPPEVIDEAGGGYWALLGSDSALDGQPRSDKYMMALVGRLKGLPVSPEEVLWGMRSSRSRCWGLASRVLPGTFTNFITPGIDMLNHLHGAPCRIEFGERDSDLFPFTRVLCHAGVPAGSEVFIDYGKLSAYVRLATFGFIAPEDRVSVPLNLVAGFWGYYAETLIPGSSVHSAWARYEGACAGNKFEWTEGPFEERARSCLLLSALSAMRGPPDVLFFTSDDPPRLEVGHPAPGLMGAVAWYVLNTISAMRKAINTHNDTEEGLLQGKIDSLPANAHPALPLFLQARLLELKAYKEIVYHVLEAFNVSASEANVASAREHLADLRPAPMALFDEMDKSNKELKIQ